MVEIGIIIAKQSFDISNLLVVIGFCLFAYFCGSIPSGYIIAKIKGIPDIRETGSGSTGGTNVSRELGIRWGLLVAFLDGLKCFLPTILVYKIFGTDLIVSLVIFLAVIGHIFPVWLKFRGGKGVASAVGGLIGITPYYFILLGAAIWLIVLWKTKYVSLSSLILFLTLPAMLWFPQYSLVYCLLGVFLFGIIAVAHRENIGRLIRGEENKFKLPEFKKKKT